MKLSNLRKYFNLLSKDQRIKINDEFGIISELKFEDFLGFKKLNIGIYLFFEVCDLKFYLRNDF